MEGIVYKCYLDLIVTEGLWNRLCDVYVLRASFIEILLESIYHIKRSNGLSIKTDDRWQFGTSCDSSKKLQQCSSNTNVPCVNCNLDTSGILWNRKAAMLKVSSLKLLPRMKLLVRRHPVTPYVTTRPYEITSLIAVRMRSQPHIQRTPTKMCQVTVLSLVIRLCNGPLIHHSSGWWPWIRASHIFCRSQNTL